MQCDFKGGAYIENVETSHEKLYILALSWKMGEFLERVGLHSHLAVVAWAGLPLGVMVSHFLISLETMVECQM